ncbi:MAG: alpha/beta hydrolase-fold protein [Gammaproteobacteria bacterium]|nr:alpha/beta hydrolase-fold protein [Gammaproteobacteria bacterium]MDE0365357.1 alpha/beta hydrolase-fold protein [Gammaproteobacteria bacterium]
MTAIVRQAKNSVLLALALCSFSSLADEQAETMGSLDMPDEQMARFSPDSKMPTRGTVDSVRLVRADGWAWDHEVRVYLPPSYHVTDRKYPALWITDNNLELIQGALIGDALGFSPELIVVAVGAPTDVNPAEFQRRRSYDFIPDKSLMGPMFAPMPAEALGGAPGFLDFLVNRLRPMLAGEYRMDLDDQGYAGHSGGGQFGLYVLLNKPESFHKYIISSPAAYQPWLDMEERWHEKNRDLKARVFLSAGEGEAAHPVWSAAQIVSTVATMAERLTVRRYPSLELTVRIFPGEDHLTVMPIAYTRGIRVLWGN